MSFRGTFRPQNKCYDCSYRWHPKGKDRSYICPRPGCGSKNVAIVNEGVEVAPSASQGISVLTGCGIVLALLLLVPVISAIIGKKEQSDPVAVVAVTEKNKSMEPRFPDRDDGENLEDLTKTRRQPRPGDAAVLPLPRDKETNKIEPRKDLTIIEPKVRPLDPAEQERKRKELAENDAKFRLSATLTLVEERKFGPAVQFAKDLIRLHPGSRQAEDAQRIIDKLSKIE